MKGVDGFVYVPVVVVIVIGEIIIVMTSGISWLDFGLFGGGHVFDEVDG